MYDLRVYARGTLKIGNAPPYEEKTTIARTYVPTCSKHSTIM